MGLLPIPAPKLTQGASRAGFWRAAALYDKRLPPPSVSFLTRALFACKVKKHKQSNASLTAISIKAHPSHGGMFARRATFLLTIPTSARDLPSDGEGPLNGP